MNRKTHTHTPSTTSINNRETYGMKNEYKDNKARPEKMINKLFFGVNKDV
jgi:hypothetical protein